MPRTIVTTSSDRMGSDRTLYFSRSSFERPADMSLRRVEEGALKCAFRDLDRVEAIVSFFVESKSSLLPTEPLCRLRVALLGRHSLALCPSLQSDDGISTHSLTLLDTLIHSPTLSNAAHSSQIHKRSTRKSLFCRAWGDALTRDTQNFKNRLHTFLGNHLERFHQQNRVSTHNLDPKSPSTYNTSNRLSAIFQYFHSFFQNKIQKGIISCR